MAHFGSSIVNRATYQIASSAAIVAVGLLILTALYWWLRKAPPATTTVHSISADVGFETVIIGGKEVVKRRRDQVHPPKSLSYKATNGPVDIYAIPISLAYRKEAGDHVNALKKEFAEGGVPKEVVRQSSGSSGQFNLVGAHTTKSLHQNYLILIRSATENSVTLEVQYQK